MRHRDYRHVRFGWMAALLFFCGVGTMARAQEAYTSGDNNFGFKYPKRWRAEAEGTKVHLVSPDGNSFLVQQDVLKTLPSGPPAYDSGLKAEATQLASRLLPKAELVRGQTAVVDHGAGAVFRFQEKSKGDDAPVVAVWVAIIGKHSVVIVPEKAAQAGEAIGLSTIIQSVTFADSLPPPAPVRPGPRTMPGSGAVSGTGSVSSGPHTVSFQTQIAPILSQRCRACHNGGSALGGLNAASFSTFLKGGEHGALVAPGRPNASLLLDYLTGKRDRMPKGSDPLSADQIALFRTWIQEGATDDATAGASDPMTNPGAVPARTRRANANALRTRQQPVRSNLLEGYAGHLVVTDTGFTLNLMRDGTATADWTFSPTVTAHFTGAYRGKDGSYGVSLTLASGSTPYQTKTMVLDLRPHGEAEIGRFGLDTDQARRDISNLALSQFDVDFKKGGTGTGTTGAKNRRRP